MAQELTYIELAEALARHVYKNHYKPQQRIGLPPIEIFDDLYMSSFQIPAGVLKKLGILVPLNENWEASEDGMRAHVFCCEPAEFRKTIESNHENGCSFDALVLANICMVEFDGVESASDIFNMLVQLGVCEAELILVRKEYSGPEILKPETQELTTEINWTEKKKHLDTLYLNWPELIA